MKITHTYAVSDLHGRYDLWEKIKSHLQENDVIYFLGDAIDRGPDGLKLMQELLTDKRVHYIIGNHEEMMLNCGTTLSMLGSPNHYALWLANEQNKGKDLNEYIPKDIEVTIKSPQRQIEKRPLFNFLDDEEEENN